MQKAILEQYLHGADGELRQAFHVVGNMGVVEGGVGAGIAQWVLCWACCPA